jgi:Ca2+/Na+ antiporter
MVLFGVVAIISTIIPWGTSTGEIIISIIGILSVILSIGTTYTIISNNK